jgi:hypothetical protein
LTGEWVPQGEISVIEKPEYHFVIEEWKKGEHQMLFLHLTVHKWSLSVFKEILRNWKLFRQCVQCPVFAIGGTDDTEKWERFVSTLGFLPLQNVICENGAERRLFIHSNKEKEHDERPIKPEHQRLNSL